MNEMNMEGTARAPSRRVTRWVWAVIGTGVAVLFAAANFLEPQGIFHRPGSIRADVANPFPVEAKASGNYGLFQETAATHAAAAPQLSASSSATVAIATTAAVADARQARSSRDIVEQATLVVQTKDSSASRQKVDVWVSMLGGYVSALNQYGQGKAINLSFTLRVPVQHYDTLVSKLQTLGKVHSMSQSGRDVTQQALAQANNLAEYRAEESAYLRLYNRAKSMSDMLKIQQALVRVQQEIATTQQASRALNQQVQFATIQLTVLPTASPAVVARTQNVVVSSLMAVGDALGRSLLSLVLFVAWLLPWAAVVAVIGWLVRRFRRR